MKKILFLLLVLIPLIGCGQAIHKSGAVVEDSLRVEAFARIVDSLISEGLAKFEDDLLLSSGDTLNYIRVDAVDTVISINGVEIPFGFGGGAPAVHAPSHELAGGDMISHDDILDYVANEHIDHTSVGNVTSATSGLSGGENFSANSLLLLNLNRLVAAITLADADQLGVYVAGAGQRRITWVNVKSELNAESAIDHDQTTNTHNLTTDITDHTIHNSGLRVGDSIAGSYNRFWDSIVLSPTDTAMYSFNHRVPLGLSVPGGGGGGASNLLDLTDTPNNYTDDAYKNAKVNLAENAVIFVAEPVFNVKAFGAIGNGIADETVACQATIDAAVAEGKGTVYFPTGKYRVTDSLIVIGDSITIMGDGGGSIIIADATGIAAIRYSYPARNFNLKNIEIWGNGTEGDQTWGSGATNGNGVELNAAIYGSIENVTFRFNGGHGVYAIHQAWGNSFINCLFTNNAGDGLNYVDHDNASTGNGVSVISCVFNRNGNDGIEYTASGLTVIGSLIEGNRGSGVQIGQDDPPTQYTQTYANNNISNNWFELNDSAHIKVIADASQYYPISSLIIDNNHMFTDIVAGDTCDIILECSDGMGCDLFRDIYIGRNYHSIDGSYVSTHVWTNALTKGMEIYKGSGQSVIHFESAGSWGGVVENYGLPQGMPIDYSIVAGTGIAVLDRPVIRVNISSPIDITANPQIVDGDFSGQELMIIGKSDVNTLTLDDGNGLSLTDGQSCVLGEDDNIVLKYIEPSDIWKEISRSKTDEIVSHTNGVQVGDSVSGSAIRTIDSIYISGDSDEYLNFQVKDMIWQIIRPFGQAPDVFVADYYISPTGNDVTGDGSFENPWFTLEQVWTVVASTDTVYCRGGTYEWTEEQDLAGAAGASGAGNMIYVFNYPGEQPVFRKGAAIGGANPAQMIDLAPNSDYIYMKGLEIKDFTQENANLWCGLRVRSSDNCIFDQLNIHHCGMGMRFETSGANNLVINSDFHHNSDPLTASPYDNADGLQFYDVADDTNYVQGCRFWYNSDDGTDNYDTEGRIKYDSCWSWYNGYIPSTFTEGGNGQGFKLGRTQLATNNDTLRVITNSIAFANKNGGFASDEAYCNVKLYNNIAFRNGLIYGTWAAGFDFRDDVVPTNQVTWHIKNNASLQNNDEEDIDNGTNETNNSWQGGLTINAADYVNIYDTTSFDNARKTGGWLPDIVFGELVGGGSPSDLIDAGVDVGIPFLGVAPDIGPFEKQ